MFLLGMLGVLQMTLLPGLLLLKGVHLKGEGFSGSLVQWLVYSFGFSLIVNFLIVFFLTALGLYLRPVVVFLLLVELILLVWVFRHDLRSPLTTGLQVLVERTRRVGEKFSQKVLPTDGDPLITVLRLVAVGVLLGVAVSSVLWAGRVLISNVGSVFSSWDAIYSWNRWAVEWAANGIPTETSQYPQLLPANWSLSYVLTGDSGMQLFVKATMPLFLLYTLMLILDLGLEGWAVGAFIAVEITRLAIKKFTGEFIAEGYADVPLAFFALLAVHPLLRNRRNSWQFTAVMGLTLAAGAAVTKQPGLFLLGVYPLLSFLLLKPGVAGVRQNWKILGVGLLAAAFVSLAWYGYNQIALMTGAESSNLGWLTGGIYGGASLLERAQPAWLSLGKYAWLLALLIPGSVLLRPAYRWLALLVVLPWAVIWLFMFSYDTRNTAMILPLLGLCVGELLGRGFDLALALLEKLHTARLRLGFAVGVLLLVLVGGGLLIKSETLQTRQEQQQRRALSAELNESLYQYFDQNPGGRVLTNYPVNYLPGLQAEWVNYWYADYDDYMAMHDRGEFDYLLVPGYADQSIQQDIEQRIAGGEYVLLFENHNFLNYRFIKVVK